MVLDDIKETMNYIEKVTEELNDPIKDNYYIEDLGCPHIKPKPIPKGYAAVYIFVYEYENGTYDYLKIGKANPKSSSRFVNQHYGFNASSTLARSLCSSDEFLSKGINQDNVKEWMLENLHRVNIYLKVDKDTAISELVESILHYKYRPKFEGNI